MSAGHAMPMSAEEMLSEARRITGIEIRDEAALEPLRVLLRSYNEDAGFTVHGAKAKHDYIMRFLTNRLRMQRDFAAHPEIHDIPLKTPLIINAMGRTGSTKLQKVLAATGAFNYLPMWMALNPASYTGVPHEDPAPRIADTQRFIDWFIAASPMAHAGHAMIAQAPDEDSYVMMHSMVSQTLSGYAAALSYLDWYVGQDLSLQFKYVRDTLKYLVWQGLAVPEKPFVLKSAMSVGYETGLIEAYGDVKLVMTHRDPKNTVGSACKLIEVFNKPFSDQAIVPEIVLGGLVAAIENHIAFRGTYPDVPIYDVDYRHLRDDAVGTVAKVLDYAGISATTGRLDKVRQWEAQNPKNKQGAFRYALEDFGLTGAQVEAAFSNYIAMAKHRGIDVLAKD